MIAEQFPHFFDLIQQGLSLFNLGLSTDISRLTVYSNRLENRPCHGVQPGENGAGVKPGAYAGQAALVSPFSKMEGAIMSVSILGRDPPSCDFSSSSWATASPINSGSLAALVR